MKTNKLTLLLSLILIFFFSLKSFSQFEQKYTLQVSWGLLKPTGYMDKSFKSGFTFDAGAQFNISRSFSIVGLAKFGKLFTKDEIFNVEFSTLGLSICPKYRFMANKKVNPYILGGLGLSFSQYRSDFIGINRTMKFPTSFGYTVGGGIDFSITDNLALFIQTGYSSYSLNKDTFNQMFTYAYAQFGLNVSFAKSKSL